MLLRSLYPNHHSSSVGVSPAVARASLRGVYPERSEWAQGRLYPRAGARRSRRIGRDARATLVRRAVPVSVA